MPVAIVDRVTCDRCGEQAEDSDTTGTDSGDQVCPACVEDFYTTCDRCDAVVESDETSATSDGGEVCQRCVDWHYRLCDRCDRYDTSSTTVASGAEVCESCLSADYWGCDRCGDWISSGDYCDDCEYYRHDDCLCSDCTSGLIHDYYYRPTPVFHGEGPLYMGVELEIDVPRGDLSGCADVAVSHLGKLGYLKDDSSIDHGFEIVTHPMSYGWAIEHFPWSLLRDLSRHGCDHGGNGLHVHVSRAAFDHPCHVFRWLKFFYRNRGEVTEIARRTSSYASFFQSARDSVKRVAKGEKGRDRYEAINTLNDNTFELRIFASTLNEREVKAALGLAAASVEYTRDLSVRDITGGGWEWPAFAAWVAERPEYAPLAREIETRGLGARGTGDLACAC